MLSGKVTSVSKDKGFGFIQPETGTGDLFFHHSSVEGGFEGLEVDEIVDYEPDAASTKPRAKFVKRRHPSRTRSSHDARRQPGRKSVGARDTLWDNAELGFITKMRPRQKLGFISADKRGPELLFGSENVTGPRPFGRLSVGDSVRFIRGDDSQEPGPPLAVNVQYHDRKPKKVSNPELPNNPKARRKKPTWR